MELQKTRPHQYHSNLPAASYLFGERGVVVGLPRHATEVETLPIAQADAGPSRRGADVSVDLEAAGADAAHSAVHAFAGTSLRRFHSPPTGNSRGPARTSARKGYIQEENVQFHCVPRS